MKVRTKLFAGFFFIAFLALIIGIAGLYFQTMIGNSGLDIGINYAPLGDAAMEIKLTATTAQQKFEKILGGDEGEDINNVWDLLDETLWYTNAIINGGSNDEGTFISSSDSLVIAAAEKIKTDVNEFRKAAEARYSQYSGSAGVGSESDQIFDDEFDLLFLRFFDNADIAEELIHDSINNQIELLHKNLKISIYIFEGLLIVVVVFAFLVSILISRGISVPLQKFQELFNKGANGNLSVRSTNSQKDEIGNLSKKFNNFMKKLGITVNNIKKYSNSVDNVKDSLVASAEATSATIINIKNSTSSLLKESEKMDINVSENVSSVEQITGNINSIKDQINEQVAMVEESTAAIVEMISSLENVDNITKKKTESVLSLVEAIKGGNDASAATDVKFQVDVIDKIDGISSMAESIQAIAAQTNLLSMNAAIEAAHAGDAGKGFAVVADEIRKLADTSSKSSTEITKIIKEIADGIAGTGVVAQKKVDAFAVMNTEIIETKNAFDEIVTSVQELNSGGTQIQDAMVVLQDVSSKIKNAAEEMTVGAEQVMESQLDLKEISNKVNKGMMEISSGSEEIVVASDEIVRHSTELNSIVNELKEETDIFIF